MYGITNYEVFLITGIVLNLTPGADTMYILGRSISQGKKAGILSALGIASGALVHCLFASFGLSIVLAQSALIFEIVKYTGAVYLIYLGVKLLWAPSIQAVDLEDGHRPNNHWKIYFSGMLTNVLNPKVALFFLAFIPQFIDPGHSESPIPFFILGISFVITGTLWCLILAVCASKLSKTIRNNPKTRYWLTKTTAGIFIVLGIKLAFVNK